MLLQRLINRSRLAAGLLSLFVVASCASSGPTRDAGPIAAGGAGAPGGSAATSPAIPAAADSICRAAVRRVIDGGQFPLMRRMVSISRSQ